MSKVNKIILHCSDSPDNLDIGVTEIRTWHTAPPPQGRGFKDIGYQAVVRRSGVVEFGRYENGDSILEGAEIGAHTLGHNADSYSICWVGKIVPAPRQYTSLLKYTLHMVKRFGLSIDDVFGHYEFNKLKTCPNLNMPNVRVDLTMMLSKNTFTW